MVHDQRELRRARYVYVFMFNLFTIISVFIGNGPVYFSFPLLLFNPFFLNEYFLFVRPSPTLFPSLYFLSLFPPPLPSPPFPPLPFLSLILPLYSICTTVNMHFYFLRDAKHGIVIEEESIRNPGGVGVPSDDIILEERRQVFFYFVCSFFVLL